MNILIYVNTKQSFSNSKIGGIEILNLNLFNFLKKKYNAILSNKITKKILNLSLLEILIIRLMKKFGNQNIIICTSGKKNNFYTKIAKKYNVKVFYGDEKNIFKRISDASKKFKVNNFVRVTGDNPLTDPDTLAKMILIFIKKN